MAPRFVHLHTHSHYSLLSALPKIPALVAAAKKDGMDSLALTDNGNLYGAIEFYKECKKEGIKPIIGIDAYLALRGRFDKQAGIDNRRFRLVLLAKNLQGYKNLMTLVTKSHLEGFYYKPRLDKELLAKYSDGLICILPSFSSDIVKTIGHDSEKAKELVGGYREIFGNDLYLEITHHPEIAGHSELMKKAVAFGKECGLPPIAAHDVYYEKPEDRKARLTLTSIQTSADVSERSGSEETDDFSFISSDQAERYFESLPDALKNTRAVADQCNLTLELGRWVFPEIDLPQGKTAEEELRQIVYQGIERRNIDATQEIKERIEYELGIINQKGFASYFLIVSDLLNYAHKNNILSNIRGSVSGSMVTYLAGVTNINPLEYQIPFERFLNPERPSPPDIDMDFADTRRDEMVEYTKQKFGEDKVAQIGTFGTMMARGSVRDVARALGFSYGLGDTIAKLIPMGSQGFPMTIDKALETTPELAKLYREEKDVQTVIDMAKKIEGCARHISIHAAGVVIAPTPLTDYTPLQFDPKGEQKIITQYDMYSIEEAGLLKFDFLGLKNLSIISETVKLVQKTQEIQVDINEVPLEDKKTFAMLARGKTADLFQLNGDGMTKYLMDLKPTTIHDINAMVALYRPGPIQFIPEYIERKHNPSRVTYLDPALKEILKKTYGILVYQDDLLIMAHDLAGYSWSEVDKFRKAVGKKIPEQMAQQKEKFIKGCIEHSKWSQVKAERVWTWIEPFAAYGFNKAHSVSYGRVAYQTAYLKANFPSEYMTSVLTAEAGDVEKVAESIAECKRLGIPVLAPDINESYGGFTVIRAAGEPDKIRFGLYTVKNFGQGIADAIIGERKKNGRFLSFVDFLERVRDKNLNKKSLEALIKCGAMDALGERGHMLANMTGLLAYNKERALDLGNQDSLFGLMNDPSSLPTLRLEEAQAASIAEKLAWEKELLGLYISGHPLDNYKEALAKRDRTIKQTKKELREGMQAVVAGIIEEVKPITTKSGDTMAFTRIADFSDAIEVVMFPRVLTEFKSLVLLEKCIAVKGRLSHRNGATSLIAEKVKSL
ncbi:MAG: DNA polymerase III subunit alpha [bacterium]|nr:DNA polymerase III subunit alpha [bacterium]